MNVLIRNRASAVLYDYLIRRKLKYDLLGSFLLPANICPVVPWTFLAAKVPFEFIDISSRTLCIDEEICFDRLKKNPSSISGILFNHSYGTDYNPLSFFNKIKNFDNNLSIIDDRCLCMPTFNDISELVDISLFSTGYGKYIDLGGGGFGVTINELTPNYKSFSEVDLKKNEENFKKSLRKSMPFQYTQSEWLDLRRTLNEIENISLAEIHEKVELMRIHKNSINGIYDEGIKDRFKLRESSNTWRYNIWVKNKDQVLNMIFKKGLFASGHYADMSKIIDQNGKENNVASKISFGVINLFNDYHITEVEAIKIVKTINEVAEI